MSFAELLADQMDSLSHSDIDECFDYAVRRAPEKVASFDYGRYCLFATSMMREVSKLLRPRAAEVMRDVLAKLYGRSAQN